LTVLLHIREAVVRAKELAYTPSEIY